MFCPKCGTKNPENGKYCRTCGTDLSPVSAALTGAAGHNSTSLGIKIKTHETKAKSEKPPKWESAITNIFVGIAFLIISVILGITNAGNSSKWWFWMLIPGFACLGTGIAHLIQIRTSMQKNLPAPHVAEQPVFFNPSASQSLPPTETEYVSPESRFKTGELVAPPASITEHTTRHLEMNTEGETMTLPKK